MSLTADAPVLPSGSDSVAPPSHQQSEAGELADLLTVLVAELDDRRWSVRIDEAWAHADLRDTPMPLQGWKLHVSATEAHAAEMLRACAPILLAAQCDFKVARTLLHVRSLTAPHCDRGSAGKVLTAYPRTDAEAVDLGWRLHDATVGLKGPRILNDRSLCTDSAVHYRYGVFTGTPVLTHDGEVELRLVSPDGTLLTDKRGGTFTPPSWAADPFVAGVRSLPESHQASGEQRVLLGERFVVREAIRHANRGGVFRAEDSLTGEATIVKQARAHVGGDERGRDTRERLRHEAYVLDLLADAAPLPRLIELFEQGGDLFLAEQDIAAPNLRTWISGEGKGLAPERSVDSVVAVLEAITAALDSTHQRGVILRDLSPNNVLVLPDHTIAFIDPELAITSDAEDDLWLGSGTPAYAAPEQLAGATPNPAMDMYGLGALILFAFTAEDPLLGVDGSTTIDEWMARGARRHFLPPGIAELASRLCGAPATRPPADKVVGLLDSAARFGTAIGWRAAEDHELAAFAVETTAPISEVTLDAAIDTLLQRLCLEVSTDGRRVARASMFGERTLSTNVQHGAAGLLGVLVQATRLLDDPRARSSARFLAAWLDRMPAPSGGAVGLHFGHAGPAWALAEAGAVLDDGQLLDRAVERALEIPIDFPGPDICQGLSGLGLTLVRLCELSRDRRTRDRVAAIANALASWAERDEHGITWRTPATAPSTFAGRRYHGFAHGTAGVGTFLRSAAELLADDRLNQLSIECVSGLELGALHLPDGRVLWGSGPEEPSPGLPHWCNGSSGVATFLVRMHRDLPQASILDGAARAIMSDKWHCGMAYCHGLAGNADALLDLHDTLGGQYRAWAADLLQIMWDRRQVDGRGPGLSDELGHITPDFGVGYGGALSVLLRLRYGGPRLWLPEGLS